MRCSIATREESGVTADPAEHLAISGLVRDTLPKFTASPRSPSVINRRTTGSINKEDNMCCEERVD